jgi:hypothetical protein
MSRLLTIRDPAVRSEVELLWQEIVQLKSYGSAKAVDEKLGLVMIGQKDSRALRIRQPFDSQALTVVGLPSGGTQSMVYLEKGSGTGYMIGTSVAGCYLSNGGVWTSTSSASKKIFLPMEDTDDEHLAKVQDLMVAPFEYKKHDDTPSGERHIGPTAEDFQSLFGVGDGQGIAAMDLASVALLAIQSLTRKVTKLEAEVARLSVQKETTDGATGEQHVPAEDQGGQPGPVGPGPTEDVVPE